MGRMIRIIAALLLVVALAPARAADYWLCVDASGHRTAQDRPCSGDSTEAPRRADASVVPAQPSAAAAEPRPLLSLPRLDGAALERHKPLLRQGILALLVLAALALLWRGVRRLHDFWSTREPRPRKPAVPERIEPSDELRRQARHENST